MTSPTKPKHILILDNNSPFVLPLLRSFSGHPEFRMDVLLVAEKKARQFRYSRYMGRLKKVASLDDENVVDIVRGTAAEFSSELIIPTREWISSLLFRHRDRLESFIRLHPLPADTTLAITSDKWNLNQWLGENAFPAAKVKRVNEKWDGPYPVLLKPLHGIGGKGIRLLQSVEDTRAVASGLKKPGDFFLQEFLQGEDRDVSFFALEGSIIYYTMQRALIPGKLVYSRGIEFFFDEKLLEQVKSLVSKLKYTGIAHLDFRYRPDTGEYFLVDFNSRYWSSVQGSRAMGINFPVLAARYALNEEVLESDYQRGAYYFSATALRTMLKNIGTSTRHPVQLKHTQLAYLYKDPLPEFMTFISNIRQSIKGARVF